MAIELPRAAGGSVSTSGRRRGGSRLPDAGDVPRVDIARDPGVQVPDTAQFAGSIGDVGAALGDVGARLAVAEERATVQREGVARDRDDTSFFEQLNAKARELEATEDFADDRVIKGATQFGEELKQQIIQDHDGGEISKEVLSAQLDRRLALYSDDLSGKNIAARRLQLEGSVNGRIRGIIADMGNDPSVPIEQRFAQVDDAINFLGLSAPMAEAARDLGREQIATARLSAVIRQADIDDSGLMIEARSLMEDPLLREVLPSETRSGFANRIFEIENTIQRVGLEARAEVALLEAVASELGIEGESATDFVIGMMTGGGSNVSDKRAALDRLVDRGLLDQDSADKIASNVLRVAQIRNAAGDLENVIVDLTRVGGGVTPIDAEQPSPEGAPGATPAEAAAPSATPAAPVEAPTAPAEAPAHQAAEGAQSLFGIVAGPTAVTGLVPSAAETIQGLTGQFGVDVASAELLTLRNRIDNTLIPLATALVPSTRFPVAQVDLVINKANIETGPGTDRRSLLSSIVALDETIFTLQQQAEADSRDGGLPNDVRQSQAENATKLRNFRDILGVPLGTTPADIEALGEPEKGGINEFISGVREFIENPDKQGDAESPAAPEQISVVPTVAEISKMAEDEVRALVQSLDRSAPISEAQVKAIKKKLGVE